MAFLLERVFSQSSIEGRRTHGSTFGGNPLAMAVANVVLDHILKKDFLEHVLITGNYLKEKLNENILSSFQVLSKR